MSSRTLVKEIDQGEAQRLRLAWIFALLVLLGGTALWIAIVRPQNPARVLGLILGLAFLPGKYLIFAGLSHEVPLGPMSIGVLATSVDLAVALTLAVGLGWLARFEQVRRSLKSIHDRAELVLKEYPRLKRMAFGGVVLFVFLPLPASGAIGGTFVAQFLGLSRTAGVVAVTLGGVIVSIVFVTLASWMGSEARTMVENPWITGISVAVFLAFVWVAWRKARAALKKA
jgi:uncharacterized membrane protein